MAELFLHGHKIRTIFNLLGQKENDITFSLGWALAQCESFLNALIQKVLPEFVSRETAWVRLQETGADRGYTDIEIEGEGFHIIVEAKRGWNLPSSIQLEKYAARIKDAAVNCLVVMAEAGADYAKASLPPSVADIPIVYLNWRQVADIAGESAQRGRHADKRLLHELRAYLEGLMTMQNQSSNRVYVVALASGSPEWSGVSWRDIVNERGRYFHPIGTLGWPKEPPNYVGFRYDGWLQSIHHVDNYQVLPDLRHAKKDIPEIDIEPHWADFKNKGQHFLYLLGPAIRPPRGVKSGKVQRASRVWAALDLLLTCETIGEARDKTKARGQETSEDE